MQWKRGKMMECDSAINGNVKTIHLKPCVNEKYDLSIFLRGKKLQVLKRLEADLKVKKGSNGSFQFN